MQENIRDLLISFIIWVVLLSVCLVQDAKAATAYNNMDSTFTTIVKGDDLQKIETWEQPRTEYTPGNLRSQYQIRFSGKDGSNKVTSYTLPITDYDTYITGIYKDPNTGKMYVLDNANRKILTGIDNSADINKQAVQIENQNRQIKNINQNVQNIQNQVNNQQQQINKLNNRLEGGLATVTALTGLHPNPRATEKLEVSVATGMYADNVAGAVGIFYHPNDRVQLNVGASYGGDSQFAGSCGVTFSLGKKKSEY